LCSAAKSWAKNGSIGEMVSSLNEAKDLKDMIDDGESSILKIMADIYDILNDNLNCLAFMEGFIDQKPYDHNTRFSLAYKYSKIDEHDLSLYHYNILIEQRQDKIDWNNIGWARESSKLPGKSIASYRESEKMGETLAMSNLAYSFMQSGFFNEAKELCLKAKDIPDYNERVDFALAKISELKTEEDKKENDLIKNTKRVRSFYIEYAHACSKKPFVELSGIFKGPDCELDVIIENNKFEAKGSFEKTSFEGSFLSALSFPGQQAPIKKTAMVVEYIGELIGQGIKYKLRINEKGVIPTLLGDIPESGIMIIKDDLSEIKVYQKGTRTSEKFYSLFRIE
jgi:tetratricopeptide (TPR) repeat protein